MNKIQEHLVRAGHELGITVIAPFALILKDGSQLSAEALLPELGAPKGTIVFRAQPAYSHAFSEIKAKGYTCSSFEEPLPAESYDVEAYKDMFSDWGWTDEMQPKPQWMN